MIVFNFYMAAFIKDVIHQGGGGSGKNRRGGGRGQAKIDVFNFCVIMLPFEEIYEEFFQ